MKSALGLVGWQGEGPCRRCCWMCLADQGAFTFRDPSLFASWRATVLSHTAFVQDAADRGSPLSTIFGLPGLRVEFFECDLMHCGDLGTVAYLEGNVLLELFGELNGSCAAPEPACRELLLLVHRASRELQQRRLPISSLALTMFRPAASKAPKFRGKASENRLLLPCLLKILAWMPRDTAHKQLRYDCVFHARPPNFRLLCDGADRPSSLASRAPVAVCSCVLRCLTVVRGVVWLCVAVWGGVWRCVAVCGGVWWCVVVCGGAR